MIPDIATIEKIGSPEGVRYELMIVFKGEISLRAKFPSFNEAVEALINWTNGVILA